MGQFQCAFRRTSASAELGQLPVNARGLRSRNNLVIMRREDRFAVIRGVPRSHDALAHSCGIL
jgi:hypothetical protein